MKHASETHEARKALFQLGIQRGHLTLDEIDRALPSGSLSPAERWLLFYSLRASGVEIRDRSGANVETPKVRGISRRARDRVPREAPGRRAV